MEQIKHEFVLIARQHYAPFFLTVEDIVRFACKKGILHQGRGSAANSAVCFALGITEVDPARANLLFERFISDARDEPPDIDVDFEHEKRGKTSSNMSMTASAARAGLCAAILVVCYRTRGAVREVGKALGLSPDVTAGLQGRSGAGAKTASIRKSWRASASMLRTYGLRSAWSCLASSSAFRATFRSIPAAFHCARTAR